jgi:branched-chain amino acid transport system permease protein
MRKGKKLHILQLILKSFAYGSIYALVGLGLVLIFRATDVLNFGQGQLFTMGAYLLVTFWDIWKLPYSLAFLLSVLGTALLGMAMERVACRPLLKAPVMNSIIATFMTGVVIYNAIQLVWGPEVYTVEPIISNKPISAGKILFTPQDIWITAITVIFILLVYVFLQYTKLGTAFRATSQSKRAASLMGVSVKKVFSLSWVMSGVLAGVSGVLLAPVLMIEVETGWVAIKGFCAAIMGGFSIPGTIMGGFLLAAVENIFGVYVSVALKDMVAFLVILAVLLVKPSGLFRIEMKKRV